MCNKLSFQWQSFLGPLALLYPKFLINAQNFKYREIRMHIDFEGQCCRNALLSFAKKKKKATQTQLIPEQMNPTTEGIIFDSRPDWISMWWQQHHASTTPIYDPISNPANGRSGSSSFLGYKDGAQMRHPLQGIPKYIWLLRLLHLGMTCSRFYPLSWLVMT